MSNNQNNLKPISSVEEAREKGRKGGYEKMKLRFLINVNDKYTDKQYKSGKVYEFKEERANELLEFRYNGNPIVEKIETKKSKTKE